MPGHVAGEVEAPPRVVRRTPAGGQPPQIEPGAHVVRAAGVGEDVRQLERRVELVPVRAAAAEAAEGAGEIDGRDAGVAERDVAIEAGNAEIRAGDAVAVHGEVIQRVEIDAVVADPEIVEQRRRQRVRVRDQRVLVDARLMTAPRGSSAFKTLLLTLSCQL